MWCTAPTGGTVKFGSGNPADCPQSLADVSGLRVWAPGEFSDGEGLTVRVVADARGNVASNVMNNLTVMRVDGIDVPVSSADRTIFDQRDVPPNPGSIEGIVWKDVDSDGVREEGDGPVPGTLVVLRNSDGIVVGQATTLADGSYFLEVMAGQAYTLEFTPPADSGLVPTKRGVVGTDTRPDSVIDAEGHAQVPSATAVTDQYRSGFDAGFRLPGTLAVTKSVSGMTGPPAADAPAPAQALVGDTLTYAVTVENTSANHFTADFPAHVADDLSDLLALGTIDPASVRVAVDPAAGDTGAAALSGSTLTWSGPLAPGAKATITYALKVTKVDDGAARNTAWVTPTADPGQAPADCAAPSCAQTDTAVVPRVEQLTVAKKVAGASGAGGAAVVGDILDYEVTLTNTGNTAYTSAAPATLVDDVLDVVDVGEVVTGSVASDKGAAPTVVHNRIVWSGALGVGESVTVTYQVRLTDPGDGDAVNDAFVTDDPIDPSTGIPTDPDTHEMTVPPTPCTAPACATTTTKVLRVGAPLASVAKTVSISSGAETAVPGDTLTYTVTVSNVGDVDFGADAPATLVDDLARVLDHGAVVEGSVEASVGAASVRDGRLTWTGPITAGQHVTITYQVKVTAVADGTAINLAYVPVNPANPVPPASCPVGMGRTAADRMGAMLAAPVAVDCVSTTTPVGEGPVTPTTPPAVAPTPLPTTPTMPYAGSQATSAAPLAFTGAEIGVLALGALGLVAVGLLLIVVRRRHRYASRH